MWAVDKAHFQQYGSRCHMWIPPEYKDPVVLHHPTRRSVGYFGAVRLREGKFVYRRETEQFNARSFWDFLKKLRRVSCHERRRVVLVLDNAKYHHATLHQEWRREQGDRFTLELLPPYSPDLNHVERVWKLTRRTQLHNRYFPAIDNIITAVEECFDEWVNSSETLRCLCSVELRSVE